MSNQIEQDHADALTALLDYKRDHQYWHTMGTPFLINTGRSVELDADADVIEVYVYVDNVRQEKVFLETDHFVDAVASGKTIYTYKIDDGNNEGRFLTRRIEIRHNQNDGTVLLFAAEKDERKWRALGGTTRPGCCLAQHEYNTLVEYAKKQHTYGQACNARRQAQAKIP